MKVKMCDPPSGWKYGFPKPVPNDLPDEEFHQWLVKNGYPKILLDSFGDRFWCRFWVEDVKE